jgi:hypothetical protein
MSHNGCYDNSLFCPKGFELPILTQTKTGYYIMPAQIFLLLTITLMACTTIPSKKESIVKVMPTSTADENGNQELRFTGTIRNIHFGAAYCGMNQILVDDKLVRFKGASRGMKPDLPCGPLIGFDFARDKGSDDFSGYNGRQVEVYCAVDFASGPNMEKVPIYTLYGKQNYFIRIK